MDLLLDLTLVCALVLFILGIDDLILDIIAYLRRFYRHFTIYRRHKRLTADDLDRVPQKMIAVMIPAWAEHDVITRMLSSTLERYNYDHFRLFVGVYQNDPATLSAVKLVQDDRIIVTIIPHPGPTNKADCLNSIYSSIGAYEERTGQYFEIYLLHDAEDLVHPLELKLMNYLIPRKDMVQLPVVPIVRRTIDFISGHYMDEFAESHGKDLLIREWFSNNVPSAGVGCGFSRRAIEMVARSRNGKPFNNESLTEDYDFSLQVRYGGLSQIFVRFKVNGSLVATQEYFPNTLSSACRQKARWLIGITFQSLMSTGWRGSVFMKYALYRDRKGVLTSFAGIFAYSIAAAWSLYLLAGGTYANSGMSVELEILLLINFIMLFNRSLQRAIYVTRIYGPLQGLLSVPRQIWGNAINFLSACRAIRLFHQHLRTGKPLGWDKTQHEFPDLKTA